MLEGVRGGRVKGLTVFTCIYRGLLLEGLGCRGYPGIPYYTKLTQHEFNAHLINVVLINVFFRQKRILKDIN